ncbi:hypothetical protein [Paenibacillus illinoisensis]|uniref:hypothetical protein n=1 Tax=Paenibacillus illinoisensis TaxID=59845 RepID=UPI003015F49C
MAKKMYADIEKNGRAMSISVRASSEKEARVKLEQRKVTIIEISPLPPRKWNKEAV